MAELAKQPLGMDSAHSDSSETRRLLGSVRKGDPSAFGRLFERHRDGLLVFLTNHFDPRLRARLDPSDVVQEAHLEAMRRFSDYLSRRPMPFRVWLWKTGYERLLMQRRRHLKADRRGVQHEENLPNHSSRGLARRLAMHGSSPSERMQRAERVEKVRRALARLSESDREILLMRNYEDMPYEEIGVLLDIAAAAARQRHGRALLRLSGFLSDAGFGTSA